MKNLPMTLVVALCASCSCDSTVAEPLDGGGDTADAAGLDGGPDRPDAARDGAPPPDDGGPETDARVCVDADGDGVTDCDGDCDDADRLTFPGAAEVCGDGVDNGCGSDPDPVATCAGIGTHVSPAGSDATGDGTQANPVRTIGRGIQNAVTIGAPTTVVVAGGDYEETVTVVEGVSIVGGFDCASLPCGWAHAPATSIATVDGLAANAVDVDDTVTRGTRLEHLTITSTTVGVAIRGGAPTLRSLSIDARTGVQAFGTGTDPLIEDSTVLGESAAVTIEGAGVVRTSDLEGAPAIRVRGDVLIERNVVHAAGDSGIQVMEGDPQILANMINEDGARVGTCSFGFCSGVSVWGGSPYIANNVIYGMGGATSAAVAIVHGELVVERPVINSNTLYVARNPGGSGSLNAAVSCESFFGIAMFGEIRNNIVVGSSAGTSFGFYEVDDPATTCRPVLFEANLFTDVDHVARFQGSGGDDFTTSVADANGESWGSMNAAGDPMLDGTHHLMAGSPAIDIGVATDAPATDRDGDARPSGGGYDVGADERL